MIYEMIRYVDIRDKVFLVYWYSGIYLFKYPFLHQCAVGLILTLHNLYCM